ncbi:unnamed protein product [Victoria cruziana]
MKWDPRSVHGRGRRGDEWNADGCQPEAVIHLKGARGLYLSLHLFRVSLLLVFLQLLGSFKCWHCIHKYE